MSVEQARREIADALGAKLIFSTVYLPNQRVGLNLVLTHDVMRLWPKGIEWTKNLIPELRAWRGKNVDAPHIATVPFTGDFLHDFTILLAEVLKVESANQRKD